MTVTVKRSKKCEGINCMTEKFETVVFEKLEPGDDAGTARMSELAMSIVREYYDPILGIVQNDYMIDMFQSVPAIKDQLGRGVKYFFIKGDGRDIGFFAFYPKNDYLYLSKFYIEAPSRGRGAGTKVIGFLSDLAKKEGLSSIRLNVNKNNGTTMGFYESAGFECIRAEVNDIGGGFVMDDFVYSLKI